MSWSDWKIDSNVNGYMVAKATLNSVGGKAGRTSTVVDFLPPGKDFVVIANTGATNLSASTHVELYVGYTKTGTFYRHKPGVKGYPFIASRPIDNTTQVLRYDCEDYGTFPYYKLYIPGTSGPSTNVVIIAEK